jgi:hypothetical protein
MYLTYTVQMRNDDLYKLFVTLQERYVEHLATFAPVNMGTTHELSAERKKSSIDCE